MQKKVFMGSALICLVLLTAMFVQTAKAQGTSPSDPASIGTPVKSFVELGSVNASNYDITITVLEVVRGEEAMKRLKEANAGNQAPKAGFEYILALVSFDIRGRAVTDNRVFDLGSSPLQWVAYSADFTEYESVSVTLPKPGLSGLASLGKTVEGWVVFAIEQNETKPLMTFDPDSGGATGRGKSLFFKLY